MPLVGSFGGGRCGGGWDGGEWGRGGDRGGEGYKEGMEGIKILMGMKGMGMFVGMEGMEILVDLLRSLDSLEKWVIVGDGMRRGWAPRGCGAVEWGRWKG